LDQPQPPQPALVLDYASPRPHVKLRLASNSILRCDNVDGRFVITELLSGKGSAVGGMIFAAFCVSCMIAMLFAEPGPSLGKQWGFAAFVATIALVEIAISLLIVRNTWRRTVVSTDRRVVEVIFSGPLMRTQRYGSPTPSIEKLQLASTDAQAQLGELVIAPVAGAELHLFTDHSINALRRLIDGMTAAMGMATAH
jgi:hypothetical protein